MMINFLMKMLGLQSAVDALDGQTSKAYIGGVGMILGGLGSIFTGLCGLFSEIGPLHGASAYLSFAQNLGHDSNAGLVMAGYLAVAHGYSAIGSRHATAVLTNIINSSQSQNQTPLN